MPQRYFSIRGCERDGWTLNVYSFEIKKAEDGTESETGAVTTFWNRPKEFKKLADLLQELITHEEISNE